MNKKTYRILAIVALVFVGIFSIAFILFLFDPKLGNGIVAVIALVSGVIGLGLFSIVKVYQKKFKKIEDEEKEIEKAKLNEGGANLEELIADKTEENIANKTEDKTEENTEKNTSDKANEKLT